jgi:hypothetical protein
MVKNRYISEAQEGPTEARKRRGYVYLSQPTKRLRGPKNGLKMGIRKAAIIAAIPARSWPEA